MKRQHRAASPKVDNQTSRIAALGLLALLLSLALTGCKHSSRPTTNLNPAGNYTLINVDGQDLPCRVKHDGVDLSIKSGTFTITAAGQCRSVMIFSPPRPRRHSPRSERHLHAERHGTHNEMGTSRRDQGPHQRQSIYDEQ